MENPDPTIFMAEAPVGTVIYGFASDPSDELLVEVLIREKSDVLSQLSEKPQLQIRTGCFIEEEIPVVVVLFRFEDDQPVYQTFWNFRHEDESGDGNIFSHMSTGGGEMLFKFFGDSGKVEKLLGIRHPLSAFFTKMEGMLTEFDAWSEGDFREAVAGLLGHHPAPDDLWNAVADSSGQ